jgi:predicted Zn-dependent protease
MTAAQAGLSRPAPRPAPSVLPRMLRPFASAAMALATALAPAAASAQSGRVSLIRDTEVEAILQQQSAPIFRAAGLNPADVKIHIVGDKELNAFVARGQQIFITTGLLTQAKTPNELLGVIAHETGHIAGGHIARQGEGARPAMATMFLTLGLGVLAAIAGAPDAAAGLVYSSSYFATLTYLGYSRVQEASADQAAAGYLENAGMSGKGLVTFFDNFRSQEIFSEARRYAFFRSHPLTSDRIEALRLRVEKQPHYGTEDTPEALAQHALVVAKIKAFMNHSGQTFVDYKETDTGYPARYARAIAYYKATQPDKAVEKIDALIAEQPTNPYLYELKGQVLFESGRIREAEPAYRQAVALKPDAPLILALFGQTLIALEDKEKLDEAVTVLRHANDLEKDNPFTWRQLAEAYDRKGMPGMARLATAEQYFALEQSQQARVFAMRARENLPKNSPEWRRATDIVMTSGPSKDDLKILAKEGSAPAPSR